MNKTENVCEKHVGSFWKYLVIYIFAAFIFLGHYSFSRHAVYGDGIDYWVYLPSVYFDHDIDFTNQFRHYFEPIRNNLVNSELAPEILKTNTTDIGKTDNVHPPGTALVWAPAFITADVVSLIFNLPRNGYADAYQILCGLWSVFLVIFALYVNEKTLSKFVKDKNISFIAIATIFFASPLLYYGSYDVLNSHSSSFFVVSLFWYLLFTKPLVIKNIFFVGVLIGLGTLIRFQEILLIVPVSIYFFLKDKDVFIKNISLVVFVIALITSPLLYIWNYLYGKPLPINPIKGHNFRGILGSLFHPTNGLFFRTPIILASLYGLERFFKRFRTEALIMEIYFVLQFILITYQGGWQDAAYGGRMYISSLPFFIVCLAYSIQKIKERFSLKHAIVISSIFCIINLLSISSFVIFEKETNAGKKRGLEEQTQTKVENILNLYFQY